ncbi:MAG TPA: hypothetical protein VGM88_02635 [Kofleriaceae bacterium]|jgi:hypothetical protein
MLTSSLPRTVLSLAGLIGAAALATACTDDSTDPTAPATELAAAPLTTADGAPLVVATGGTVEIAIDDAASIGTSAETTGGLTIEPTTQAWPSTAPTYWLRAVSAAGGTYEISTNHGAVIDSLAAADIASASVAPADYVLAGGLFALDGTRLDVQLRLADAAGERLVDATAVVTDDAKDAPAPLAWDRATLAPGAGEHTVRATADSLRDRAFPITVVASPAIDRTETTPSADGTMICVHAYAANIEIVTADAVPPGPSAAHAANCTAAAL